jgi:FkbM family methyltransferase
MNTRSNKLLYRKVSSKTIPIQKVCEVGVYLPETSNIIDFIKEGKETILVEPEPNSIQAIKSYFQDYSNVTLIPVAIYKHNGTLTLAKAEASTFVSDLPMSPALINDQYQIDATKNIDVECKVFSDIDEGDIDLLSIDTEGSEWYVLLTMVSRPKIISIETHGKFYVNPFLKDIKNWMKENDYQVWFKDNSDSVFCKKGLFNLSLKEKMTLSLAMINVWFRRNKKYIKFLKR